MTKRIHRSCGCRLFRGEAATSCEAAHVAKPKARLGEPWVRGPNRILWELRSGDLLSPQVLLFELYSVTGQESLKFFLK